MTFKVTAGSKVTPPSADEAARTVAPSPIRLRITRDAPPNPARVAAFAELETAARRYRIARHSDNPEMMRSAQAALDAATIRLETI